MIFCITAAKAHYRCAANSPASDAAPDPRKQRFLIPDRRTLNLLHDSRARTSASLKPSRESHAPCPSGLRLLAAVIEAQHLARPTSRSSISTTCNPRPVIAGCHLGARGACVDAGLNRPGCLHAKTQPGLLAARSRWGRARTNRQMPSFESPTVAAARRQGPIRRMARP